MVNEEHVAILRRGVEFWNQWRKEHPEIRPDLCESHLQGADLSRAIFYGADLSLANLRGANLQDANLQGADLSEANLIGASFHNADLRGADLSYTELINTKLVGADLSGTDLSGAHFSYTVLSNADLGGARLNWTMFGDVDLSEVKDLDTVNHEGPSTIGIDTITKSQGKIPEVFLKGAGVPDVFITYMQSLTGAALEYYSCFISYSSKDQAFVERLYIDLQAKGVRCWYAPEAIQGGKKIHEQIDYAIRLHDKLLLVLSEHSMASEWVKTEVYNARQQELEEKRRKLFPISLVEYDTVKRWQAFDADRGKDMAREVREYFIPNFTNWKDHDAYQTAFDRLLRDLKAE